MLVWRWCCKITWCSPYVRGPAPIDDESLEPSTITPAIAEPAGVEADVESTPACPDAWAVDDDVHRWL